MALPAGRHEHQRLHDLPDIRADRVRRVLGRVGALGEDVDVEGHALLRGGVEHALDGRVDGGLGHGGESTRRARPDVAGDGTIRLR